MMSGFSALLRWGIACVVVLGGSLSCLSQADARAARGGALTEQDLRACMGLGGADPAGQVAVCTRILNSGRVRHPHQSDYHAWRAGAYLALKQTKPALEDLDKAISLQDKPAYRFQRALVHMARASLEAANKDLDAVVKATPDFAPAYFMRGAIAYREAAYSLAVTSFDMAVSKLPTYYQAIYARGLARMKVGEEEAGRKDLATARGMSGHVEKDIAALGLK
jgi:tetratricopeptide (TPR) repeat protein